MPRASFWYSGRYERPRRSRISAESIISSIFGFIRAVTSHPKRCSRSTLTPTARIVHVPATRRCHKSRSSSFPSAFLFAFAFFFIVRSALPIPPLLFGTKSISQFSRDRMDSLRP